MDKKQRFKQGLFFGIVMAIFSIVQDLFTHEEFTDKRIFIIIIVALISGAIA
jgi:hypothetical protein